MGIEYSAEPEIFEGSEPRQVVGDSGRVDRLPTVQIVEESSLPPERILAAAHDFSEGRSKIFSAVRPKYFEVHSTSDHSADITEGTKSGPVYNCERCVYDWSKTRFTSARQAEILRANSRATCGSRSAN
jgi:hypothetical protein